MKPIKTLLPALVLLCAGTLPAHATDETMEQSLLNIQHQWAHINYQLTEDKQKEEDFAKLEEQAGALATHYPERAEPLVWQAIVLSSHAGVHGGFGALKLVDQCRKLLEQAEAINPDVLHGSIYTSLGTLYYQVPGWPLSFGNDDKAKAYLEKALALNPDGIDPNYFYGDYLYRNHQKEASLAALNKALQAPPRPNRPVADEGRRKEIQALIDKINHNG